MTPARGSADCLVVGEYLDEAETPRESAAHDAEPVRPQVVGEFRDAWGADAGTREFTVLLKDGRVASVLGHTLKYTPQTPAEQDVYGIVIRNGEQELTIALFKSSDVAGIFCGELRLDRKPA